MTSPIQTSQLGTPQSQWGRIAWGVAYVPATSSPTPPPTEPEAVAEQPTLGLTIGF